MTTSSPCNLLGFSINTIKEIIIYFTYMELHYCIKYYTREDNKPYYYVYYHRIKQLLKTNHNSRRWTGPTGYMNNSWRAAAGILLYVQI